MSEIIDWHPERHPDYDTHMKAVSEAALAELAGRQGRHELLDDPRPVHRRLYCALAPARYPEFAGTYRGTKGTTLETRRAGAKSVTGQPSLIAFEEPDHVASALAKYPELFSLLPAKAARPRDEKLRFTSLAFVFFGKIHPFLDGNGHVQRLIFVAVCRELGLHVSPEWTIHPRAYDIEFASCRDAWLQPRFRTPPPPGSASRCRRAT
jgi:fido (protein-threonine AMPylation protein)